MKTFRGSLQTSYAFIVFPSRCVYITIGSWYREAVNAGDRITLIGMSVAAVPMSNYDEIRTRIFSIPRKILCHAIIAIVAVRELTKVKQFA